MTLRSRRKVPPTPPSLVRFAANAASVITAPGPRDRQRPRPRADEDRPRVPEGHGGHRRAGVVRGHRDHVGVAEPRLLRHVAAQRREPGSGLHDVRQQTRRYVEALEQVGRPAAGVRVEALRRRRVGELGGGGAAFSHPSPRTRRTTPASVLGAYSIDPVLSADLRQLGLYKTQLNINGQIQQATWAPAQPTAYHP